ncbi:hypothetical protein AHAS_Ahas17G0168700 [Arachis hypogaea]
MFQATGIVVGIAGFNIANFKGGKVGFASKLKTTTDSTLSIALSSAEAEAPTAAPARSTSCPIRAKLQVIRRLAQTFKVSSNFSGQRGWWLYRVLPHGHYRQRFHTQVQEPHGRTEDIGAAVPRSSSISLQMLKSNNRVMNTLETQGANKFDFTMQNDGEDVKLEMKVDTTSIVRTLIDQDPFVAYKISKVLMSRELFKMVMVMAAVMVVVGDESGGRS